MDDVSHRPIRHKQVRRLEKVLRHTPPGYIDLVREVRLRTRCTAGVARAVLLSGVIKSESHTLRERFVPASHRATLRIEPDEEAT